MNPAESTVPTCVKEIPAIRGLARFKSPIPRVIAALVGAVSIALSASAQTTYNFSTMAGIGGTPGFVHGTGGGIGFPLFNSPSGVVVNKAGNIYVTDLGNQLIREVTPAGSVTTFAGTVGRSGTTDGTGISALFGSPMGPAIDKDGNLYVADFAAHTIRKITTAGVVTTFAGTAGTAGSTDGTGTAAKFSFPSGIAIDGSGTLYVADTGNNTIRKITSAGVVTTFAGTAGLIGSTDATGTAARFYYPRSIAIDSSGNLFVADTKNNTIRKIKSTGEVTLFAGTAGTFGSTDAVGTAARFNFPNSLAIDASGNLYVADELNNAVRKIAPDGTVTTLAGLAGVAGGAVDATGSAARFNDPCSVSVDGSGNVYVADYKNQLIRKISSAGAVTTVAGAMSVAGALDGVGYNLTPTLFFNPSSTTVDGAGNVYVADTANGVIRKITSAGVTSLLAGNVLAVGSADGTGSLATFNAPSGVASDAVGNVYVADTANHLIRKVDPAGVVTTFAGTAGVAGSTDAVGTAASFNFPTGIAIDSGNTLYVADYENHVIRKITSDGTVSTLAGLAGNKGSADGTGGAARFNFPRSVAVNSAGTVYVADSGNNTIRTISPGGAVLTLAGSAASGSADGIGTAARFNGPGGIAVGSSSSNIFVSDSGNSTIRMVTVAGVVTTIGGTAGLTSNLDGAGTAARFDHPAGLSVDASGNLYIADIRNQTIRKGSTTSSSSPGPGGPVSTGGTGGTGGGTGPTGINGNGGTGGSGGTNTGSGFLLKPVGVTNNPSGGLYVADTANNSIKAIASDGTVTVLAGKDGTAGSTDGTGTAASFNNPTGIVIDSAGNLYVCDTNNGTVRKVTSAGVVTTLAGSASSRGSQDGTGSAASFVNPTGIAMNSAGDIFVTDSTNDTIRKITTAGVVTTFAGVAKSVGDVDGAGTAARFNNPMGVTINTTTNYLYVADTNNHTIRRINTIDIAADTTAGTAAVPAGTVTTLAGSAGVSGAFDGAGPYALFNLPMGVSVDSSSNVYVADTGNSCIRRIGSTGTVITIAGIAGITGNRDGTFTAALFNQPQGVLVSSSIVVADTGNSVLRGIASNSVFTSNLKATTTTTPSTGGSSGGGGNIEPWFVAALLASAVAMKSRRRTVKA